MRSRANSRWMMPVQERAVPTEVEFEKAVVRLEEAGREEKKGAMGSGRWRQAGAHRWGPGSSRAGRPLLTAIRQQLFRKRCPMEPGPSPRVSSHCGSRRAAASRQRRRQGIPSRGSQAGREGRRSTSPLPRGPITALDRTSM